MALQALGAQDGDRIEIAHRVLLDNLVSGAVLAAVSSGGSSITVDRQVVLAAATTYAIQVRAGDGVLVTRTITSVAGTYARGDAIAISGTWPDDVAQRAPYAIGVQGSETLSAEIVSFEAREDNAVEIEALEYRESALADA